MVIYLIKKINTKNAPEAKGQYSQAVIAGDFIFLSGQLPINPKTGKIIDGNIKEQTTQTIGNIREILATENIGLDRIVKVSVYLKDLKDFIKMNQVYSKYFTAKPARETVQAVIPLGAKLEISCIAYIGDDKK
ncbi:hypothetical protein GF327_02615 [Candidatus Woesearchaeota archaeon]|nr:hypothetical protein [Candidatus Woesearchaeota archaeon]